MTDWKFSIRLKGDLGEVELSQMDGDKHTRQDVFDKALLAYKSLEQQPEKKGE